MFFIAVLVLGILAMIGALIAAHAMPSNVISNERDSYGRRTQGEPKPNPAKFLTRTLGIAVPAVLILLVGAWTSVTEVENGHIGMVKQFGELQDRTRSTGLNMKAPWQSIDEVSVQDEKRVYQMGDRVQHGNLDVDVSSGAAVSQDSQAVSLLLQINYTLDRNKAVQLYRETGGQFLSRVLDGAVFQNAKAQTAAYKAINFAGKREEVRIAIETALSREVEPRGITINNVNLIDVGFSATLSQAIEQTVEAEQQAKRAQAQVKIKEAEGRQLVATAQAEATALTTKARAERAANRLRRQSLTPLLVQQQAIEKLNPNVEIIVCPPRTVCVPNTAPILPEGK